VTTYVYRFKCLKSCHRTSWLKLGLLFFFRSLWWFFRLRHFHLLSQVVTHTQIFRYPPGVSYAPYAHTPIRPYRTPFASGFAAKCDLRVPLPDYLPMQNSLKILPSKSSVSIFPTTSPTASSAPRNSMETNSGDFPSSRLRCAISSCTLAP